MISLRRTVKGIITTLLVLFFGFLAIGWIFSLRHTPVTYGLTFSVERTQELGLDWKKTYLDILTELQPKYVRLSAAWPTVEPAQGQFNWAETDWLLDEAGKRGVLVTLAIGQKTPRWPECRWPIWARTITVAERKTALLNYAKGVVEHYHSHPALEMWQVENEPFIPFEFGECDLFDRDVVSDEVAAVRSIDQIHPVLMTDSGELGTWREALAAGDWFGTTLYRVVNFPNGWPMYYDWVPPKFFALAAWLRGTAAAEIYIAELQGEPWFTRATPLTVSAEAQTKLFPTERLERHAWVAEHIGSPRVYWWGAEWWYFMKEKQNEPAYWHEAREIMQVK